MNSKKLSIVIMAAGRGTRMNSDLPKVLHHLSGKTLLNHVIATAEKLNPENIVTVIGHEAKMVQESVNNGNILFSIQKEQKGTGHAVMQTRNHLESFDGNTLVQVAGLSALPIAEVLAYLLGPDRHRPYLHTRLGVVVLRRGEHIQEPHLVRLAHQAPLTAVGIHFS